MTRVAASQEAPRRVLFACTFNAVRSAMAAAILRQLAGQRFEVASAGVMCARPDPFAAAVMDEIGIDMSLHEPADFSRLGRRTFDIIITLSPEAHHHALEMTRVMACDVEYWPTFDPSSLDVGMPRVARAHAYRRLRDDLVHKLKERFMVAGGPTV